MQVMKKIKRKLEKTNLLLRKSLYDFIPWSVLKSPSLRFTLERDPIDCIFYSLAIAKKNVFFVQVGSNDATHGDPLRDFIFNCNWSGIMIEPVKFVFKRLEKNFSKFENITLENVAISNESGVKDFYYLQECDDLPVTYDQLGSFSLDTILKNSTWIPDIQERIVTTQVDCITFAQLCKKNNVTDIDIIHIDTEGYDFEIIKMIDFECFKPKIILYEHKHLSLTDKAECRAYLQKNKYELLEVKRDTIALAKEAKDSFEKLGISWDMVYEKLSSNQIINS